MLSKLSNIQLFYSIFIIFSLINSYNFLACDYCNSCNATSNTCELYQCTTDFNNTEENTICQSDCDIGYYRDGITATPECLPLCPLNLIQDDIHNTCENVISCPQFDERGQLKVADDVNFVIADSDNSKIIIAFGSIIQIYSYTDYSLQMSYPKQNDNKIIYLKKSGQDIIAVTEGCDQFIWNYSTGSLKSSVNYYQGKKCYLYDDTQNIIFGYEGTEIYAINHSPDQDNRITFFQNNVNITNIAAKENDIYTMDTGFNLKRWDLSQNNSDSIDASPNSFNYETEKLKIITINDKNCAILFFKYPSTIPAGGAQVFIGYSSTFYNQLDVSDINTENIIDIYIKPTSIMVISKSQLVFYIYDQITTFTKQNNYAKNQQQYIVNNDRIFLVYENVIEEYPDSNNPTFSLGDRLTYNLKQNDIKGVVYDGPNNVIVFGKEVAIYDHTSPTPALQHKILDFPYENNNLLSSEITSITYDTKKEFIVGGSKSGKIQIIRDTMLGRSTDTIDNPSFTDVYSISENRVIKILVNSNTICALYEDGKFVIYDQASLVALTTLTNIMSNSSPILDMQFSDVPQNTLILNSKDEIVEIDISNPSSVPSPTQLHVDNDKWNHFQISTTYFYSCTMTQTDSELHLWTRSTLALGSSPTNTHVFAADAKPISSIYFIKSADKILIGAKTGKTTLFDIQAGPVLNVVKSFSYIDSPINKPNVNHMIFDNVNKLVTFHSDGLAIFWDWATEQEIVQITFLKPTESVKIADISHNRFFTVLNYYTESEIIEWDWNQQIFKTISKYQNVMISQFEVLSESKQLVIGFEDGTVSTKSYDTVLSEDYSNSNTAGIKFIPELQILITYTDILQITDFTDRSTITNGASGFHAAVANSIKGVEIALDVSGTNYAVSYSNQASYIGIWDLANIAVAPTNVPGHSSEIRQVIIFDSNTKIASCAIGGTIVISDITNGSQIGTTITTFSVKQIGFLNDLLISYDTSSKLTITDITGSYTPALKSVLIDQIQGFVIDEQTERLYVYAYNIKVYDMKTTNKGVELQTIESGLNTLNVVTKIYLAGDHMFIHDREQVIIKDRVTYTDILDSPINPTRIDVQQLIIDVESKIMVVYSQSEGFEEIFIYEYTTGRLINSLLSSQSIFSGRNYGVIFDPKNNFIIKMNSVNLIIWDIYKGKVMNFMGYQHTDSNPIKGAYLDKHSNTIISYANDKIVYWYYSIFIRPYQTILPRKQKISVTKTASDVYYSDKIGDIFNLNRSNNELKFLKTLDYKPKHMIALTGGIVVDQGNDIHVYSLATFALESTLTNINPEQLYSHPSLTDKIFLYTRDNHIKGYGLSGSPATLTQDFTFDKNSETKIFNCVLNPSPTIQHLICYYESGAMSVINLSSFTEVGGLHSDHTPNAIRGIAFTPNKLISFSDKIVVYTTYDATNVSGATSIATGIVDDISADGPTFFVADGADKLVYQYNFASLPTAQSKKIVLPCKYNPKVHYSNTYNRLIVYCDYQINIYQASDLTLINFLREPQDINNIIEIEQVQQLIPGGGADDIDVILVNRDSGIELYSITSSYFSRQLQFKQAMPEIIEKTITVNNLAQKDLNIQILGASQDKIFNYNQDIILEDSIVENKRCTVNFDDTDKQQIHESFMKLENSLSSMGQTSQKVQIHAIQDSTNIYAYTQQFQDSDKDIELIYSLKQPTPTNQNLIVQEYSFSNYTLPKFLMTGIKLDFSQVQDAIIYFSEDIQELKFIDMHIIGDLNGCKLDLNYIEEVIIYNLIIKDLTISNQMALRIENANYVKVETLVVENVVFQNGGLIEFVNINNMIVKDITFRNCQMDAQVTKIIDFIQIVKLDMQQLTVTGNTYEGTDNCVFIQSGGIEDTTISNINFNDNIKFSMLDCRNFYDYNKKTITLTKDISNINTGTFNNNTMVNSLIDFIGFYISISQLTFTKNICPTCQGSSIQLFNSQFEISVCTFRENQAKNGGGLYIKDSIESELNTIESCNFILNDAKGSGGGIYVDNSDLKFIGSTPTLVQNNSALLGGGIRYKNKVPHFINTANPSSRRHLSTSISNLTMENNVAAIMGNNVGSYARSLRVDSVDQKILGNTTKDRPSDAPIQLISIYDAGEMASGNIMKINVTFYDDEDNQIIITPDYQQQDSYPLDTIQELDEFSIKIFGNNTNLELEGDIYKSPSSFSNSIQGYIVDEMKVHSIPGETGIFYITSPAIRYFKDGAFQEGPYVVQIEVNFRQCIIGEVLDGKSGKLKKCLQCPSGKYSLKNPSLKENENMKCKPCPYQAEDCYGRTILLKNSYWREHEFTDLIEECHNNKGNCKAESIPDSEDIKWGNKICKTGHIGPLCEECDTYGKVWNQSYKKDPNYSCLACSETGTPAFILPLVFFVTFIVCYIIFAIRVALRLSANISLGYYLRKSRWISVGTSAVKDYSPFNIKQFMHYLQLSKYANTYFYLLPAWVTFIPDLISVPIEFIMSSLDCAVSGFENIPIVYVRAMWSLIIPFIYVGICLIVYSFLVCIKKIRHSRNYMFNGITFLMLYLQPGEVQILISVVSCRSIGGKQYITADLNYECYTEQHIQYILMMVIPSVIMWMFVIPAWIFFGLYKKAKQNQLDNCIVRFKYGFLYQEYKYKYFYWECIRLYKKLFIVIINSFYNAHNETKLIITGLTILSYYVVSKKIQPYSLPRYNNLDHWSMRIVMVLIYLNLLMEHNKVLWIKYLAFGLIILLNQGWFLYLFWIVLWTKFMHLYGPKYNLFKAWLVEKVPCLKRIIHIEQKQTMKVFENWKKARTLGRDLAARRIKQLASNNFYEQIKKEDDPGLVNIDDNEDDEKKVGGFKSNKIAPEPSLSQSQRKNDITSVNNSQVNLRQQSGVSFTKSKRTPSKQVELTKISKQNINDDN